MKKRKAGGQQVDRDARDRAADRALFEKEVARLGPISPKEQADASATPSAAIGRRARFTKRAARRELEPEATIDLHGLDRDAATARLRSFLSGARGELEVLLVVHGRGEGVLSAAAVAELDRHPRVAEHLPAPPRLGGAGARLVRLRQRRGSAPLE